MPPAGHFYPDHHGFTTFILTRKNAPPIFAFCFACPSSWPACHGLAGRTSSKTRCPDPHSDRKVEYCLTCHSDLPQVSNSHPVKTFGCVLCHGGERLALDANLAHSTMRGGKNPSDFSVVQASCGGANCHSGTAESNRNHIQRATTSIQATYAGAIANIRYAFGDQSDQKA